MTLNFIVLWQDVLMKASGSLIFEWLDSADAALVTEALSISSLLVMLGVTWNYVVMIILGDKEDIACVSDGHDVSVAIFFKKIHIRARFWVTSSGPRPIDQYTNRNLVKRQIRNI